MAKPLKFHQTLNQAPRSPKYGKHRPARASSHRDPVIGTDYGSGEDHTVTISSWSTIWTFADPVEPEPRAIPHAGIRAGEIIGHRLWWVIDGQLSSLAHRRLWQPGETIYGDTNKIVQEDYFFLMHIWGGTYAFGHSDYCQPEINELKSYVAERRRGRAWPMMGWDACRETGTFVVGTIKMWGDVVEHDHGYRAEFAKLHSIDGLWGEGDIDALRTRYGVATLTPNK